MPLLGGYTRRNIAITFGTEKKLEWCGDPSVKKFDSAVNFDRRPVCDGQTDGHLATAYSAPCIASRGKNQCNYTGEQQQ